jgi:predicted permease
MNGLYVDLRYALRSYRQAPAFFSLVIGILSLGIGISVSVFSLVDGVLVRPLPYPDPHRLVALTTYAPRPPFDSNGSVSYIDFEQFRNKNHSFSDIAVTYRTGWSRITLTGSLEPIGVQGAFVSPNLFAMFGRSPILGRTFTEEENRRTERVIVISQALWAERFGSSPQVLGQDLEIGHVLWRVIGVMPADFQVPFLDTQVWLPVLSHPGWNETEDANPRERPFWDVFARLKPGVSLASAQAEVNSLWTGLRSDSPELHTNDLRVVPLREHFTGKVQTPLFILFCAVAFLLLIACANVANLLLARAAQREHEIAVRAALGAGQGRIFRQLFTEALSFSCIAGVIGTVVAVLFVPLLKSLAPADTPLLHTVQLDERGLLFALGLSVTLGFLLAIAPASRVSRSIVAASLGVSARGSTETRRGRQSKNILVVAEFALAMVLLTGAGLLIRSFVAVLDVDLGFRPEHVLTVQIGLPGSTPAAQTVQFYRDIMQRISALPGVRAVGGAGNLFFLDEQRNHALRLVEGHPSEPKSAWKPLVWTQVAGDYFRAMEIPLVRGRLFNDNDRPDSPPVVIVNQSLARRYWPGEDPIGKRLKGFDKRGLHDDWLTVVGVVKDTRSGGLEKAPFSQIYELQAQRSTEQLGNLVIRTAADPAQLGAAVRMLIHRTNGDVTVPAITTMEALIDQQTTDRRFQTWLISVFSAAALILAALGIFALMHYSVAARTSEIGLRMAIGANPGDIARLVVESSTRLAITGIIVGGLAALWSAKIISGLLYGVKWYDPLSLGGAALLLLAVALLASYVPGYRASHIDPMTALRQE